MKRLFFILIFVIPLISFTIPNDGGCCSKKKAGRCTGSMSCRACSNCSSCKWCSGGGSCGVCASGKKSTQKSNSTSPVKKSTQGESYSAQCQAITKKGTRCSRASRKNGYCWQHGG